jgi:hypothetical protein
VVQRVREDSDLGLVSQGGSARCVAGELDRAHTSVRTMIQSWIG